jgi:hypothetical protein
VQVAEFRDGQVTLAAEAGAAELGWSRARKVATDQIRAWFGEDVHPDLHPHPGYLHTARWITIALVAVNIIPLLLAPGSVLLYVLFAVVAILLPAFILDKVGGSS